ncbi:hypothetical protein EDD21DRAFT_139600 [Dissophora ornata]|nr:hypothetical protein EDD21DRAFT_139600 [Dissophora ornata]
MSTLPIFSSSCIAPDSSGINAYLFGVPSQGRLEAYSVNLSNPLAPTSTFISAVTTTGSAPAWDGQFSLGCYPYLGDAAPADSPITVVQFGSGTTLQAVFSPNGTWETMVGSTATATPGTDVDYVSPKFFSVVGSTDGWNWFLAKTTTNTWRDIRIGEALETGSQE